MMFKSVYTKYITAFMIIIIISFTVLAAIITTIVTNNTEKTKNNIMNNSSAAVKIYLETGYNDSGTAEFRNYVIKNKLDVRNYITAVTNYTGDTVIFITDKEGRVILTDSYVTPGYLIKDVPEEIINEIKTGNKLHRRDDLGGVFYNDHLIYAAPVAGGDGDIGYVFVSSSSNTFNALAETMIKTIIIASLWVLLAALVAVYFISEKIIGPLKNMSKAAKSFASGRFDVRIPVTGRDEVSELAAAFNNMAGSLKNLEDMRRSFLANVSHDLRTPMTVIAGFIDNIMEGVIPFEKQGYYLNIIAQEIRRLSRLVNSLLDISRIQAGDRKFNPEAFDICETAWQILTSFENKIDAKKLDVEFECENSSMHAYADKDAVYQVLYNLCDNGVKFSKENGKYRIKIYYKDKKIYVSVYNEGQGIAENDLPYVFERFYKGDKSRGLDKTGAGLGLYISKTIMDAHGEDIWVNSVYGEYCEFIFTLSKANENLIKSAR